LTSEVTEAIEVRFVSETSGDNGPAGGLAVAIESSQLPIASVKYIYHLSTNFTVELILRKNILKSVSKHWLIILRLREAIRGQK